jgi:hypothetical protein
VVGGERQSSIGLLPVHIVLQQAAAQAEWLGSLFNLHAAKVLQLLWGRGQLRLAELLTQELRMAIRAVVLLLLVPVLMLLQMVAAAVTGQQRWLLLEDWAVLRLVEVITELAVVAVRLLLREQNRQLPEGVLLRS